MDDLRNAYEELVVEEDELIQKIGICEGCVSVIFDYILSNGDTGVQVGESILSAVHTIDKDLQTELLHIRLEKGILANRIKLGNR